MGAQIGGELVEIVMLLNSPKAVAALKNHSGTLSLGTNVSVAAGPTGRDAELFGTLSSAGSKHSLTAIFAYSKTKGLFAGVSIEGTVLKERSAANRKFYGRSAKQADILSGRIEAPEAAQPL